MCAGLTPWEIGLWGLRPQLWYDPAKVGAFLFFISSTTSTVHCMPLKRMQGCMHWSHDRAVTFLTIHYIAGKVLQRTQSSSSALKSALTPPVLAGGSGLGAAAEQRRWPARCAAIPVRSGRCRPAGEKFALSHAYADQGACRMLVDTHLAIAH